LLAVSIGIDAAKKAKLLKKLAKPNELGYKLEDAVKKDLKDDVSSNNDAITALMAKVDKLESTNDVWFDAFRNSPILASGSFVNVTYDELRESTPLYPYNMDIYTGIFSAPYSGVFEFMFQGFKNNAGDGDIAIMQLTKNGESVSYSRGLATEVNLFGTAILDLVVGDQVWVETAFNLYSTNTQAAIRFTGKMLK